jgi:hypothetical protein
MALTHECGLRHFMLKNNVGIALKLWHLGYMMMILDRDVIDLLKHTISTLVEAPTRSFDWHIFYGGLGIHV